jgi:hypothetical protein
MSDFARLCDAIVDAVTPELAARGFAARRSVGRFERSGGAGVTHFYLLLITESAPFARADVHLATRIDEVETIFHRTSGYEKRTQRLTPTMGGALDAITGTPELKMLLDAERGPERARSLLFAPALGAFYEDWYARFSDLGAIDRELNDDPTRETPNRPLPWLRCSTGVIVARLVDRPNYDEVVEVYSQTMRSVSDGFYWPRFEALVADLARRGPPQPA